MNKLAIICFLVSSFCIKYTMTRPGQGTAQPARLRIREPIISHLACLHDLVRQAADTAMHGCMHFHGNSFAWLVT